MSDSVLYAFAETSSVGLDRFKSSSLQETSIDIAIANVQIIVSILFIIIQTKS